MADNREFLYDKRMVDRHAKKGVLEPKQVDKYMNSLPNVESNAAYTHIETADEAAQKAES